MPDRIFVDTNILVYAHDVSAGIKHATAKNLIQDLWENKTGCLSIQVMQEFYVNVTQKVPNPMDYVNAIGIIRDLKYWKVHEPKIEDVLNAVDIQQRYQISFWDAMILQSALQLECSLLWSEDLNPDQVYESVKLINPFQ
jgi:predicted nucleic acid-binding protein